tara:strand:- start:7597 stop:8529 length:933 start_codon:yes stop_codon:yes gene_type:complete
MPDEGISPFLEQIESEVSLEASGNPNNALAFKSDSEENSVVQTMEIAAEDYDKYLSEGQRSSLPKSLQEGIIRKKKIAEAEQEAMPSFTELADSPDPTAVTDGLEGIMAEPEPDISHMGETPDHGLEETDMGPTEMGGPESPPTDPLPRQENPIEVDFLAERLANQDQEMMVASMTQKQYEDWLFPEEGEDDWASGQITLARIMANLKAAGYDANSLQLDETLFPAYVQIGAALWSRSHLINPIRSEVIAQIENAPAAQMVATLEATASAVPTELAAELFRAPESPNYVPYVLIGATTLTAFLLPFFWRK